MKHRQLFHLSIITMVMVGAFTISSNCELFPLVVYGDKNHSGFRDVWLKIVSLNEGATADSLLLRQSGFIANTEGTPIKLSTDSGRLLLCGIQ